MSTASFLPAASRARGRLSIRRMAARLAACASDPKAAPWLVIGFAAAHAVLWTLILVNLKAAQDVHMDVAEAFAWGQKFQFGYGKHPPLAGWIAGVWFRIFPVANWATYALAMATLGCGLVICWLIALRVVDRRRAFFVVVMLALYPIFNFKGFKYNPDLLQLVTLPLLVLAFLHAFEQRSWRSGLCLALAGAVGRDRDARRCHGSTSDLAERSRFRAADLCRRRLRPVEPRAEHSTRPRLCRPQSGAARGTGGAGSTCAGMVTAMVDDAGAATIGAVHARMVARGEHRRECLAGAQYLDHPDRGRGRTAARRADFHGLHENRLGYLAVLLDAAGAGRDSVAAPSPDGAVSYCRDLARDHACGARRVAHDRCPRARRESQWRLRLWRALRTGPRTDRGLADPFPHAMGGGRRHHGDRRADDVLQSGSSGAVHARRGLVVRADVARGGQTARVYRHLRYV